MNYYNADLYLLWVCSIVPMLSLAFYGLFKCGMHAIDFIIMSIVSVIPIINSIVLALLILFYLTGNFKRNDSNQY